MGAPPEATARPVREKWKGPGALRAPARAPRGRFGPPDAKSGGDERDRTADLLVANEALSQLSYIPTQCFRSNR